MRGEYAPTEKALILVWFVPNGKYERPLYLAHSPSSFCRSSRRLSLPAPVLPDEHLYVLRFEPDGLSEFDRRETPRGGQGVDMGHGQPEPPGR